MDAPKALLESMVIVAGEDVVGILSAGNGSLQRGGLDEVCSVVGRRWERREPAEEASAYMAEIPLVYRVSRLWSFRFGSF